ncbi:MAG: ABC transporter ATP-binding protein [Candidatus Woesearchaeota archaeon]|jgi:ATP-binding cassette subfamily B protein
MARKLNKKSISNEKSKLGLPESKVISSEKIDFKYNIKIYVSILSKYKLLIGVLIFFVIITELSLLVDKLLLKKAIDYATSFFEGTMTNSEFSSKLIILAIVFISIILIRAVASWVRLHLLNRIEGKSILDMKKRFFNHIVGLSHGFHTSNKTGSLISRLVRAGGAFERMTDVLVFDILPLIVQLTVVFIALIFFDKVSAFVMLGVATVFMSYSLFMNLKLRKSNLEYNDREDEEKAFVADIFTNIDSIKYFGKEKTIKSKYEEKGITTKDAAIKNWDYYRFLIAGQIFIIGAGLLCLLITPFMRFMNGQITIAEIVFIYTVYGNLTSPLFHFVNGIRGYYKSMADFDALFKYELSQNDIVDALDAKEMNIKKGNIHFNNISFNYKERKIIDKFDLNITAGKKIALVGSSGAGKSTIVKLIYRLYDVQEGEILIDGENINRFKQESLRSELSIVPQDCILFDDTIYNNIAFSRPDASRKEVLNAIKLAQLDRIIAKLPKNENTIVGERGIKLSGGERQRVSIARAILANKRILVLDEATSSLDSETEHEIQKALHELMKGRTSIIIAHRLSTIMSADTIVVLDEGKIEQIGTHNELINKKGIYKKLWTLQKGGYLN